MPALTPFRFVALLLLFEIAYAAVSMARAPLWDAFLIGDCPYYAATAESLLRDGDWDLSNQLKDDPNATNGFVALSQDQRIVPKHSVLLPILSVPFLAIFGRAGLLVFNLVQMSALILGLVRLAGGGNTARVLALAGYLSTPFLAYTYNYSPDVLGTALLVWAFVCGIWNRPLTAGLLAGLAIWAKIYLALVLAPLALIMFRQGWKPTLVCGLAALAAVLPMFAINLHLFGSPFTTGYDRDVHFTPDGLTITEHYSRFQQPMLTGLGNMLFDGRIGLLRTAPLWFLWPLGVAIAWRTERDSRLTTVAMSIALLLNLLFFARYDEWDASEFGNRFLFPALAIGIALQGPLWRAGLRNRPPKAG